jgi:RHS repeat-associated protein
MTGTNPMKGSILYSPWGVPGTKTGELATFPAQGHLGFQGQLTDALTGQVDMLTRYYEPTMGRFDTRDVLLGDPTDPTSLNLSVYGADAPVTFTDPTGMKIELGEVGTAGPCSRACEASLAAAWDQYITTHPDVYGAPPAVETPTIRPTIRTMRVDWTQTRSATAWSRYIVGEDAPTAFAQFINGWDCATNYVGCAPVNPGSVGVVVTAQLSYRHPSEGYPSGWLLSMVVVGDTSRLNPESGYALKKIQLVGVRDLNGHPVMGEIVSQTEFQTSKGPGILIRARISGTSPQPIEVVVAAGASKTEGTSPPIWATARVRFDPKPIGPTLPQQVPAW